ncbi:MAG: hypothetical protein MUF25_27945 [Pirellulaceae bacterium]|nr:hypothetical protein [Pirellulaceae bacterium]
MRDNFELVEFSLYLVGVGFVMPLVKALQGHSGLFAAILAIVAIAPFPLFLVRLRWALPERLDSLILYQSAVMFCIGVGAAVVLAALAFMGIVYRGHHHDLDLDVAVKFLHAHLAQNPDIAGRFQPPPKPITLTDRHVGGDRVADRRPGATPLGSRPSSTSCPRRDAGATGHNARERGTGERRDAWAAPANSLSL